MWQTYLVVALVAYLLGSIPFGYILVKLFLKQDIRQTGSGNIGATNVARSGKKGLAIATLLLDAFKGALAVYLGFVLGLVFRGEDFFVAPLAAVCAILGHVFPVWLRFRGGKGVATGVGAFLVLAPKSAALALLCFAIVFAISRVVSLSSIVATATFPFLALRLDANTNDLLFLPFTAAASLLIILKHRANISRLLNGTEPKFTTKKAALPADPIRVEKNA